MIKRLCCKVFLLLFVVVPSNFVTAYWGSAKTYLSSFIPDLTIPSVNRWLSEGAQNPKQICNPFTKACFLATLLATLVAAGAVGWWTYYDINKQKEEGCRKYLAEIRKQQNTYIAQIQSKEMARENTSTEWGVDQEAILDQLKAIIDNTDEDKYTNLSQDIKDRLNVFYGKQTIEAQEGIKDYAKLSANTYNELMLNIYYAKLLGIKAAIKAFDVAESNDPLGNIIRGLSSAGEISLKELQKRKNDGPFDE